VKISNAIYIIRIDDYTNKIFSYLSRFMIYAKSIMVLPEKNKYKNNKHLNSLSFELYTRQTLTVSTATKTQ